MRIRRPTILPQQVAFAWYDREQWSLLKELSADPEDLDDSFEEWEAAAIEAERDLLVKGYNVQRVVVLAAELLAWCQANAHPLNRAAGCDFVAARLQHHFPASEG